MNTQPVNPPNRLGWTIFGIAVLAASVIGGVVLVKVKLDSPKTPYEVKFKTARAHESSYVLPKRDDTRDEDVLAELENYSDPFDEDRPKDDTGEKVAGTKFEDFALTVNEADARRLLTAGERMPKDAQTEGHIEFTLGRLALYLGEKEKAKAHLERASASRSVGARAYLANERIGLPPMERLSLLAEAEKAGYSPAREMRKKFEDDIAAFLDREIGHPRDPDNKLRRGPSDAQMDGQAERMWKLFDDYLPYARLETSPGRFLFGLGRIAYVYKSYDKAEELLKEAAGKKCEPSMAANAYRATLPDEDDKQDFAERLTLLSKAVNGGFSEAKPVMRDMEKKVFKLSSFVAKDVISKLHEDASQPGNVEQLFRYGAKFDLPVGVEVEERLRVGFTVLYIAKFLHHFEDTEATFIGEERMRGLVIGGSSGRAERLLQESGAALGINFAAFTLTADVVTRNLGSVLNGDTRGLDNLANMFLRQMTGDGKNTEMKDVRVGIVQAMAVMDARNCVFYYREGTRRDVKKVYDAAVKFIRLGDRQ